MRALALGLVVLLAACAAPAEVPEAGGPSETPGAVGPAFEDAVALAVDGRSQLYVVDAGAATLVVLERVGAAFVPVRTFGGPGSGEYALLSPLGVDPTNGLVAYLADTGNGRVQQVSSDGRLLQSIRVPTTAAARARTGTRRDPNDRRDFAEEGGRPAGVALLPGGGLAVLESDGPSLLILNAAGEVERVVGASGTPGALTSPVAVLALDDAIAVADRGRGAVLLFDAYGTYQRALPAAGIGSLKGLTRAPMGLLVTGDAGAALFSGAGRLERRYAAPPGVRLQGAVVVGGQIVGLTASRLIEGLEPMAE